MSTKTYSATIGPWLKANLGPRCLGGLTGQDWPALKAAVQIIEVWFSSGYEGRKCAAAAFGNIVQVMQPELRYLAFHAIAHVGDWGHRAELWAAAQLGAADLAGKPECKYGPRSAPKPTACSPS